WSSDVCSSDLSFANKGGYVLGICNGFQILTEAGLVPGALLANTKQKFICSNTFIKAETSNSLITSQIDLSKALKIPFAHGEGNYFADAATIKELKDNDQILFRYCYAAGNVNDDCNVNGSLYNIAVVTNKNRNVFGMMPHPERAANSLLGNDDGLVLFESILSTAY